MNLRIVAAFLLALVIVIPIVTLSFYYLDALEIQGKIDLPKWLAAPVAFSIVGLILFLTKVFLRLFTRHD